MPTQDWGVYKDSLTLGTEVSSTYEGRHITATAAELNHGDVLAVVTKGYPVIFDIVAGAHGVGVAFNTEVAETDLIAVDTEGIWNLSVVSSDDLGNSLVVAGDPLFINTTTAVISKIRDNATQIPFGYALSQGLGDGAAHTCAVKVHWDPRAHWLEDTEPLYFGDDRDVSMVYDETELILTAAVVAEDKSALKILATQAAGHNEPGIAGYFDATFSGVMTTTYLAGFGTWLNLAASFDGPAGFHQVMAQQNGIYAPAVVDCAATYMIYGLKAQAILTDAPLGLFAFALNTNQFGATHTAIFYAENTGVVDHALGHLSGVSAGNIGLVLMNGDGVGTVARVNLWYS